MKKPISQNLRYAALQRATAAAPELRAAREELAAARTAAQQDQPVLAVRLAEQSLASAQLASAKTEAVKAQAVNDEMRASTKP